MNASTLTSLLDDHQLYHSDLQMDAFITAKSGGTPYGEYKQSLRELFKRYRGLKELYAARELLKLDIARMEVELRQKIMAQEDLDRNVSDTEREFARFFNQAQRLKADVGELTPERRARLDADMWVHRIKCMAALDYLTCAMPSRSTLEMVAVLPAKTRRNVLEQIGKKEKLLEWFEAQEPRTPNLPELNGEAKHVRQLIAGVIEDGI